MQLTGLEIYGFKSFADKTKFAFDSGITGIVGPNGCGKSNIVDAIRWVLGEQSAKYLRSDKMENVIFNGTNARRKANFAEVSLTFENTKNILPTEYTTITITRKLYRSGESEYLLNNVQCRLKDITGLFMDTGVSSDSYAIIELKMVEEILTNKDQERRRFFEEAAGISKYKIRKKQTLKKLEETDADLTRVEDLLSEIEKNLKNLEKQAKRTKKYFEIKAEYKVVSSQFAYLKLRDIRAKQTIIEEQDQDLTDALGEIQAETAKREARLLELKKQLIDKEQAASAAQQNLNNHIRKLQTAESEKNVKNERLKYLRQREISLSQQMETEKKQLEKNTAESEMLQRMSEGKSAELALQEKTESTLKAALEEIRKQNDAEQANLKGQEAEHRSLESELRQLMREKDMQAVRLKSLESEMARAEEDKNAREGDLDAFFEKGEALKTEVADLEAKLADFTAKKQQHEIDLHTAEQKHGEIKDAVYQTQRTLDSKQNEYNLTKSLVDSLEGFPDSVKFLKKNAIWIKDAPLLSDIISAENDYKSVIEQYLENYLSYYIVENREDALQAIEVLANAKKGRANFFILSEIEPCQGLTLSGLGKAAISVVDISPKYKYLADFLLQNVYIVENEAEMPTEIPENTAFLQKDGKQIRRKYVQSGGSVGIFEGKRLGRAKNLAILEKEVMGLRLDVDIQKKELNEWGQKWEALRKIKWQQEIEPLQRKLIEKQRDLQFLGTREKEHREFLLRVGQRTSSLKNEWNTLRQQMLDIEPEIQGMQVQVNRLVLGLSDIREKAQSLQNQANETSNKYNQANIALIHSKNAYQNIVADMERKTNAIRNFDENLNRMKGELETVKKDIDALMEKTMQDDTEILEMHRGKKDLEEKVDVAEQKVGETKNFIRQGEEAIENERKKREAVAAQQQKVRENLTEIRLNMTSLRERMSVEFQLNIEGIDESVFEKPVNQYNVQEIEAALMKLRNQVQTFGEINPMALEAFEEMQERYNFIKKQCQDLYEAKTILLNTIAEIDTAAAEKFMETFTTVRENFIKVFRSLFTEDDTCDLILSTPETPLESEIDIIARPKGKRPLTIQQLSGGEKTLTAVALLFSIYLIKPAPFCVFDEVDAPLDDANIDKFNNIIKDFSVDSQFIIVTHNKRTMAATRVMYGITMEDTGVSRMLPVSLEMLNLR